MFNMNLGGMFIGLVAAGILIGLLLSFAIPWVWEVVKPWLHAITG